MLCSPTSGGQPEHAVDVALLLWDTCSQVPLPDLT